MKKIALLIGLMFIMGCSQSQNQAVESGIDWIRDNEVAKDLAQEEDKPILIDFYTEWCGACKRLDKDTYANAKVQESLKQFICVKIDAEKHRDLSREYKISGFPSTVFLKSDGQLIEVVPGYRPPDDFLKLLEGILSKV